MGKEGERKWDGLKNKILCLGNETNGERGERKLDGLKDKGNKKSGERGAYQ